MKSTRGFTLIEMILTIIVGGILVLGIAGFVELGAKGYSNTVERQRLQTQAKFIIEKMSREVRHAVPNLFTSDGDCLSFYPIEYSGFYAISGADIHFVVGQDAPVGGTFDASSFNGLSMVINPTTSLEVIDNTIALDSNVSALSGGAFAISNAASSLVTHSIANRHYIFDKSTAREYCISGDVVLRDALPLSDSVIQSGSLEYLPATVQSNGLVHINFEFAQNGESTRFEQDIQVINVP